MPPAPQPLSGQNEPGTFQKSYPTPASDMQLSATLESNAADYIQTLYGTPPPKGTNPDFLLVNEAPIDWRFVRRKYAQDRTNEGTYNASISYSSESKDHPIFTRDYIVRRANYSPLTKLTSLAGLINATVATAGSGYTFASVSFSGGTGSGGAITAILSAGKVVQLVITAEGSYTVTPTISIVGDGSGATASVSIQPSTALLVKEDYIRQPDSDLDGLYVLVRRVYETLPGPILSGSHIDPEGQYVTNFTKQIVAAGTVTGGIIGNSIGSLSLFSGGSNYTGNGSLVFSGGGGTGAAGTFTFTAASPAGKIDNVALTKKGGGYTSIPTATISGGGGSGATVSVEIKGSPVASLALVSSDATFTDVATLTITDGAATGAGASGTATLTPTGVDDVVIDSGGSGYMTATAAFTGGGGTGAAGTVNLTGDVVTSVTMTNAGTGYTSRPTVTISGDGTGATGHSTLVATTVASVKLTHTGNDYQSPLVSCTDGSASASVTATINPTSVKTLTLSAAGSGYSSPVLTISGGGGAGATGTATLATGTVTGVALTNQGSNYTSPPTITTSGGGGSGAVINAILLAGGYCEVEPLTACKSLVMISSVDLSTLPLVRRFPVSIRVERTSTQSASLVILQTFNNIAVGLDEKTTVGGSGPVQATLAEYYMSDSQYQAFNPGDFSVTGKSESSTLVYGVVDSDDNPHVYTFRLTPTTSGTTAGILAINQSQRPYGIRKVEVISVPVSY